MRVLYYYSSLHFTSGSPKVLVAMIDALDRTGIEPLFWARGEGPLVGELERRGVEVLRGPAGPLARRHPVASLGRIRAKVHALRRARVQLLHVNEYSWNLDLVSAAALARIPVLLHVHNPVEIERWNLDRMIAARVVFVSETHLRGTTNLHRIRRKARVLHNPLDVSRYAGGRDIRASLGLAADDVMALFVGHIVPAKGVDLLLRMARRLAPRVPRLRFILAGPSKQGYEAFAEEMRHAAESPALRGRVTLLGGRDDVPDLLRSADLFVFPSRGETFGLVVGEAMSAGVPVVTSDVGGIPEVVGSADAAVMLSMDDEDGFVREVERLALDAGARRALGARGRASVESRFGPAVFARNLEQLYREVVPC